MSDKALFPTFDVPDFAVQTEPAEEKYYSSVLWDIKKGDFSRDGANRMVKNNGRDAYMQWCYKVVNTERYVHLAYPDFIGVEMIEATGQPTNDAVESCIERTISEALLVNARTEYVRDFSFTWNGDSVYCEFTVKGKNWDEFKLSTNIDLEEVTEHVT